MFYFAFNIEIYEKVKVKKYNFDLSKPKLIPCSLSKTKVLLAWIEERIGHLEKPLGTLREENIPAHIFWGR